MKQLLSILILFLLIVSCDPCDDCEAVSFEPTVSLMFINQSRISELDSLLKINALKSDTLDSIIGTLDPNLTFKIDSLNDIKTSLDSLDGVYSSTKSTINSGLLQVDQIEILGTQNTLTYEDIDSATIWSIPLSYDGEFTQYEVTIAGIARTIEFSYDNIQEVDEKRNVLIRAENIQVVSTAFDSFDNCEEHCVDGEASFTFYF